MTVHSRLQSETHNSQDKKAWGVEMSSEKYELAQDELDSIIEKLGANIKQVEVGHGEAKKRMVQVR